MKQVNKFNASPIPRAALETEAKMLALNAFDSYDPSKAQLNTHVTNHLKHLQRYVLNYQNVGKIPESRGLAISKFENVKSNLAEDLGRDPTAVELSDTLQWSLPEVERMSIELRKDLTIMQIEDSFDSGGFYDDTIEERPGVKNALEFAYFDATPEEKKILEYTFGIKGQLREPISIIAMKLGKTESYVRNKQKKLALIIKGAII
jgi:DNA-directed RNA polymerase sigma subunit (sigma70/sigma32)